MQPLERRYSYPNKRLKGYRAPHPKTGREMTHSVSRHLPIKGKDGVSEKKHSQGTLFPPHITADKLRKIEGYVFYQYMQWKSGRKSKVRGVEENSDGGALTIKVKIRQFGIHTVGAIVTPDEEGSSRNVLASVYPLGATGGNRIEHKGIAVKKVANKSENRRGQQDMAALQAVRAQISQFPS